MNSFGKDDTESIFQILTIETTLTYTQVCTRMYVYKNGFWYI